MPLQDSHDRHEVFGTERERMTDEEARESIQRLPDEARAVAEMYLKKGCSFSDALAMGLAQHEIDQLPPDLRDMANRDKDKYSPEWRLRRIRAHMAVRALPRELADRARRYLGEGRALTRAILLAHSHQAIQTLPDWQQDLANRYLLEGHDPDEALNLAKKEAQQA